VRSEERAVLCMRRTARNACSIISCKLGMSRNSEWSEGQPLSAPNKHPAYVIGQAGCHGKRRLINAFFDSEDLFATNFFAFYFHEFVRITIQRCCDAQVGPNSRESAALTQPQPLPVAGPWT
jgi:hypothetical protein